MAKVMGTVKSIIGEATATAADGTVRKLQVGDQVFTDDVISTSALGSVQIALVGGQTVECGNDASIAMNDFVIGAGLNVALAAVEGTPPAAPPAAPPGADIAALQAAIAAGADPSQVAEATAAGGAPGAGGAEGGGTRSIVVLEQGNESQVVSAGFNTEGAGITFPSPEFELLPETESPPLPVPVVSVSVEVRLEVEEPGSPGGGGDGGIPSLGGNAVSLIEGTNGAQPPKIVNFIITLDQAYDQDVQVTYVIVPGTATPGEDFNANLGPVTVTIPAGQTQIVVPVEIVQDHFVEGDETFSIVLTDAVNATINPASNSAVVTIVDDDTAPVANDDTNWAQEDLAVSASGNVLVSQAHAGAPSGSFGDAADTDDDGDALTVTTTGTFVGTYGTLVLNADGSYTYTLNNDLPAVQGLGVGQTLTDTFSYTVTDGYNDPASAMLTITIFGTNDGPVATANVNAVTEDTQLVATGNVLTDDDSFGVDFDVDGDDLVVTNGGTIELTYGTLVLNADGSYTYTLNNDLPAVQALGVGQTLTDVYVYEISDGQGGTDSATLTITINGTNDGVTITGLTTEGADHTVFENDLPGGSSPDASGLTQSGSFTIEAKDGISTVQVGGVTLTLEQLLNLGSAPVTISSAYGDLVLDGYTPGATGGQYGGTVSYQYTLNTNVDNDSQAGATDTEYADAFTVVVTDRDGSSDSATLTVVIVDDVPSISITGGDGTVVEGNTIANGAWVKVNGADGGVVKVVVNGVEYNLDEAIDTGKGMLTVKSDLTWEFVAANNLDNTVVQSVSFDLKITDADGDFASDSHTITITDGAGPLGGSTVALSVEEDDLPAGSDTTPEPLSASDGLTFTAGSDDIVSIVFGATGGIAVSGVEDGTVIVWTVSEGGRVLTGSIGGTDVMRLELTGATSVAAGASGTATVTATLLAAFPHDSMPDADSLSITGIVVVATDTDGDSATGSVAVTVADDQPTVSAVGGTIENDAGETLTGLLPYDMNADGLGFLNLSNPIVTSNGQPLTLTSNGHTVVYQLVDENGDGVQELKAYADVDGNGLDEGDTLVFTLAPTGGAEGSYTLQMHDVIDLPVPTVTLSFSGITAGGPIDEINVAGKLLISTVFPASDDLNANQGFIGINNNIMNGPQGRSGGESVRYEFGTVTATGTPNDFNVAHETVNGVQFTIFDVGNGTDAFKWTAFKSGSQVGTGTISFELDSGALTPAINVLGGYDTLILEVTAGDFKIGGVSYNVLGDAQDVNLNIAFSGADGDGDAFSGAINVTITAGDGTVDQAVQTLLNQNNM
jgi:VCBS repeat-containing protein